MSLGIGSIVSVGGTAGSGGAGSSGIQTINPGNNTGPTVTFQGGSGIQITSPSTNVILISVSGISSGATKYAASFMSTTSGLFTHDLGTMDVIVQVYTNDSPRLQMWPDQIRVENTNQVSVLFNRPQSGRVVIL